MWNKTLKIVAAGIYQEGQDACKINCMDNFDKIYFWKTPVSKCDTQDSCIPYYKWVTDYIAVLGGYYQNNFPGFQLSRQNPRGVSSMIVALELKNINKKFNETVAI